MSDSLTVTLYGGHADGETLSFAQAPKFYDAPTKSGDRHPVEGAFTRYRPSASWSRHFGRQTMVPMGFPGLPPTRAHQTA